MCEEIRHGPSTEQIVDQTGAFSRSFPGLKITSFSGLTGESSLVWKRIFTFLASPETALYMLESLLIDLPRGKPRGICSLSI